jgi:CheY-specific phosphatase CheX
VTASENIAAGVGVDPEVRTNLLEPFIAAATDALGEMAGIEVVVRAVSRQAERSLSDMVAVVEINARMPGFMVLSFPESTAIAVAERILAGATDRIDAALIRDCVAEIGNVVAGQAKAMLGGGPYQFTFSIPKMLTESGEFRAHTAMNYFVIDFASDLGDFTLQLWL